MLIWADTGDDAADEGTATPTHTETHIDTRIADALEALHVTVAWDERRQAWNVVYQNGDGYPVYDYGASGEARRDVLTRWLLNERSVK
jgi:hypothetical protein